MAKQMTEREHREILRLKAAGNSIPEIAALTGRSDVTVRHWLRRPLADEPPDPASVRRWLEDFACAGCGGPAYEHEGRIGIAHHGGCAMARNPASV